MVFDQVITHGRVLQADDFVFADIAVRDGVIVAVASPGAFQGVDIHRLIDARDRLVLPGAIDSHFHCRGPSHPEREDFGSATSAAAAGGVTTLVEMPIAIPPTTNGAVLQERAQQAAPHLLVDLGFYASSATGRLQDLESAVAAGALAFKAFLQRVPDGREQEFTGLCLPTTAELLEAFMLLKQFALPCAFHAEDESMVKHLEHRLRTAGRRDGLAHAESRPAYVEAASVSTLLCLSERFGVHVHIPHVSSRMTVNLIREAKRRGVKVTAETCPHYLQFDAAALARLGPFAKCNPPLKEPQDRDALWEAVRDGAIDTIASDHSPFTVQEKERGRDDIWLAPPGFPGVEVLVPFVLGAVLEGRLDVRRLNQVIYEAPARIFGLWPRKGAIRPGADADLVLYDPGVRGTFQHHNFRTKAREVGIIWDNIPRRGIVQTVLLRGQVIFDRAEVCAAPGCGRVLART
jgi:allantoinase